MLFIIYEKKTKKTECSLIKDFFFFTKAKDSLRNLTP